MADFCNSSFNRVSHVDQLEWLIAFQNIGGIHLNEEVFNKVDGSDAALLRCFQCLHL